MMKLSLCAALAALAMSFPFGEVAGAANAAGPHILVVDPQAAMNGSKLGQSIRQQLMSYEQKAQAELSPEGQALQKQAQAAGGKPDPALQAKETAFRQKVQDRQSLIQGGEVAARKAYMAAETAVVHTIMTERGADAVLVKGAVVDIANGADITNEVIARLDKKMTSYKVPLVKPSLSDQLQMMQQGQQGQQQQ